MSISSLLVRRLGRAEKKRAQEAEMTFQFIYSQTCKPVVGVTSVGFVVATFCKLGGAAAQGCSLLGNTGWVASALLRSVILLADWRAVSAYLFEDSRLLQHLLQLVGSIWPLLCFIASWTK
jgi:hypothetical protein